jgi:hypothetical protein
VEHESVNAKCPYYLENNSKVQRQMHQIRCEGVSNGNNISLVFVSDLKRDDYKEAYCNNLYNCRNCLIHSMLNRKYGVEDEI